MLVFRKIKDESNEYDTTNVTIESSAVTIPGILEDFKAFLMACGYMINAEDEIMIINEEDDND